MGEGIRGMKTIWVRANRPEEAKKKIVDVLAEGWRPFAVVDISRWWRPHAREIWFTNDGDDDRSETEVGLPAVERLLGAADHTETARPLDTYGLDSCYDDQNERLARACDPREGGRQ